MSEVDHEQVSEEILQEIFEDLLQPKWKNIKEKVQGVMQRLRESLVEGRLPNFDQRKPTWETDATGTSEGVERT
jgi:hypothetical protein